VNIYEYLLAVNCRLLKKNLIEAAEEPVAGSLRPEVSIGLPVGWYVLVSILSKLNRNGKKKYLN